MNADTLITGISQLVTSQGPEAKHGPAMRELHIVEHGALAIASGSVVWTGEERAWKGKAEAQIDVGGRAIVPGLVDPHTHAVWAGDRLGDFEARTSGSTYEAILAAGGGIRSTIRATAALSSHDLVQLATPRLQSLIRSGATTIEVKSGYGFTPSAELTMLEAIEVLAATSPARIVPTLLIHVPPSDAGDRSSYLTEVCDHLIPEVAIRRLASSVDVFVEKEAWTIAEAQCIFHSAKVRGLTIKLHTDQFHSFGGVELGIRSSAKSVDHLEVSGPEAIAAIAASSTVATILPGVSLHLGIPAAPGRKLIDAGAAVAVGTDLNPGSSPLFSTAAALALAVRINGLTAQEALVAGTVNAACALGIEDAGRLETGCRADFLVLEGRDWRDLIYTLGASVVRQIWIGGRAIRL
jgi:imidazolonepropionase